MAFKIPAVISTKPLMLAGKALLSTGVVGTPAGVTAGVLNSKIEQAEDRVVKAEELAWKIVNDEKNRWGEQLDLLYIQKKSAEEKAETLQKEKDFLSKLLEEEKKKNAMILKSADMQVDVLDSSSYYSFPNFWTREVR